MKRTVCTGAVTAILAGSVVSVTMPFDTVHALAIIPTTTLDVVDPNDGLVSLREAITIASSDGENSQILLTPGATYVLDHCGTAPEDSNESGDLDHAEPHALIIQSSSSTVTSSVTQTCPGERVVHHLGTGTLHLVGLAVTGGSGHPGGGAVLSSGPTAIGNSMFSRNSTDAGSADPPWAATGGGAVASFSTVDITNSSFTGNTVTNSSLPWLAHGGAVWSRFGGSVTGSRFDSNSAPGGGGGALFTWSGISILRSAFRDNRAVNGGGAQIFQTTSSASSIADTTFSANIASNSGGAVSIGGCGGCGTALTVFNGLMSGNTAGAHGGAIDQQVSQGGGLTVTAGRYIGNRAGSTGGAIRLQGGSQVWAQITDAAMSRNAAGASGGAILSGFLDLTITRGIFEENHAGGSGGVLSTNATIFGGSLGDPQIVVDAAAMRKNRALVNGGAINHPLEAGFGTPVLTIRNTSLTDNTAKGDGGAVYGGPNRPVHIDRSSITGNIARRGGGVAFAGPTTIGNVTIARNTATTGGGVVALGDAATLTHVTLFKNSATDGFGSALSTSGGGIRLRSSAITFGTGTPCAGLPQSQGGNVANGSTCGLTGSEDLQTSAPLVFSLVSGAAVPSATNVVVNFYGPTCALPDDQRGVARPQGGKCDSGAVERSPSDPAPSAAGEGGGA